MFGSEPSTPPRLVIAGGGPAGWMAAAYLKRVLRRAGWPVTVVATASASPGVLATRPSFTRFLADFGIDETIFMRRCGATYRLASRYDDWFAEGLGHWHPFGACGPRIAGRDLFHYWLKRREDGAGDEAGTYADYAPQTLMAAGGRCPRMRVDRSQRIESGDYGYHLDRAGLVRFFREIALSEGARAVTGRVRAIERDIYGDVAALVLDDGQTIEGDVFLDCTGAALQIIGQSLGQGLGQGPGQGLDDGWIADGGPADRIAWLTLPRGPDTPPFTAYRGMGEGWTVSLPLAERTHHVFLYDSKLTPPEMAASALRTAFGATTQVTHAALRTGRNPLPWQRNVVAMGAAAGAVEPLMGFDLDIILAGLEAFVALLPRGEASDVLRRAYAARMKRVLDDAAEARAAHYVLGRRSEPFWAAARAVTIPDRLADRLDLYELAGHVEAESEALFSESDHYLLCAGADFLPRRPFAPVDLGESREIAGLLASIRAHTVQVAEAMAPHALILEQWHGSAPLAEASVRISPAVAPTGPASLRATPEGARLADLVAGIGQHFGYERSVKASPAGLQTDRFLMSLHRSALGLDPATMLHGLAAKLGLPERERAEAAGLIGSADILHLGYEDGPSGALYKLYLEWSRRTDAAWTEPDEPGAEPMLVHRAYKWTPGGARPPVVTLYHWPRVRGPEAIAARLNRLGDAWGKAGRPVLGLAHAVLRLARERGRGALHYLEAREEPDQRLSYDLNLYACGLTVAEAEPLLGQAFVDLGIPLQAAASVLRERLGETLGHVAGGVGRDGLPFVTVYSGAAGA